MFPRDTSSSAHRNILTTDSRVTNVQQHKGMRKLKSGTLFVCVCWVVLLFLLGESWERLMLLTWTLEAVFVWNVRFIILDNTLWADALQTASIQLLTWRVSWQGFEPVTSQLFQRLSSQFQTMLLCHSEFEYWTYYNTIQSMVLSSNIQWLYGSFKNNVFLHISRNPN